MKPEDYKVDAVRIRELIDHLTGTCNTLLEGLNACEIDQEHEDECAERVGEEIGLCEQCSWWSELSEMEAMGSYCDECEDARRDEEKPI